MQCWVPYILMASVCAATGGGQGQAAATPGLGAVPSSGTAAQQPTGDRIVLKSGHALDGVRLLRTTPIHLVLEIVPGIEPLLIPRGQVVRVAQGGNTVVHAAAAPPDLQPVPSEPDVLAAIRMTPEFVERISAPLVEEERVFERQDIVNVIRLAGTLCGVAVKIEPEVEEQSMERRIGRWALPANASFEDFLRVHLASQAPWLECTFESDLVRISIAEEPDDTTPGPETSQSPDRRSSQPLPSRE